MTLPVIEPVNMKDSADCGVACLAMLLGKSYGAVCEALPKRRRNAIVGEEGLNLRQMKLLATKLGSRLRYIHTQTEFHADSVGILCLCRPADPSKPTGKTEGHYVVYAKETLYNPAEGLWWLDPETFLKTRRWEVEGILVREDE
jgi:ABC-type bacteriocin/lantibiotic exporters, contain an N-terminal double-glycine peptidase domain